MTIFASLSARLRAAPYTVASIGVLLVATYLCLVNLDYAALWHDEAPAAFFGKTLLQQGDIVGWDGRNLVGGTNGRTLNDELRDVLPPLMYVLNAAGFAVFGINEIGARIVHAVIGIVALGVFYLLLRQHLSSYPRLMFFIFIIRCMVGAVVVVFPPVPILFGDGAHADTYFLFVRVLLAEQASGVPTGHCAGGRVVVLQSLRWRRGDNAFTGGVSFALSRSRDHGARVDTVRYLRRGCSGGGCWIPLLAGRHW